MVTAISEFDYTLPRHFIAQEPARPKESARLMVIDRAKNTCVHTSIAQLPNYFGPNDVLVINNSKVFNARILGTTIYRGTPTRIELFLLRPLTGDTWSALGRPGRKLKEGAIISVQDAFNFTILNKHADGVLEVTCHLPHDEVINQANKYGFIPVPPYINILPTMTDYQTSYAKITGSVAAPTAGFHLTQNIRGQLRQRGVAILEVTLHVGLGTFLPVKTASLEEHHMHQEWIDIPAETAKSIMDAKKNGKRIVCIGTTTVRTLEGVAALHDGLVAPYRGDISLFIKPGFTFRITDAMLTNFHLPKSTLLVLVSSFAGKKRILDSYHAAIKEQYRFFSFGDAMLIL